MGLSSVALLDFNASDMLKLATKTYRVQMIGTAATDLDYAACGRAGLLVDHAVTAWDIEAGKLIFTEAGGKATTRTIENRAINIYSHGIIHIINLFYALYSLHPRHASL